MTLTEYVMKHARRGSCQCGKCIDAPKDPMQSGKHSVDLTFFSVSADFPALANPKTFCDMAHSEYPEWFDGKEHNYIEIGAQLGDQGLALMTIGLGHLLGAWKALSPNIVLPWMPEDVRMKMAGAGMVSLMVKK
jgi:hypothetical protein